DAAADASRLTALAVATTAGDVFRGPHLVSGGARAEVRGILQTKREMKELGERIAADREMLARLGAEAAQFESIIAHASNAIAARRRLCEARDAIEDVNRRAADAGAAHAALVERAGALAVEVERLEEAAAELEQRAAALAGELEESRRSVGALEASITAGERQL